MIRKLIFITFLLTFVAASFAQSGRVKKNKEKEIKKAKRIGVYLPTQEVANKKNPNASAKPTPTPKSTSEDRDIIRIESSLVPIPVSVIDNATGLAVNSLQKKDFQLKIDDKLVEISEVFRSESPVRLALLFDNSSSVTIARSFEQKAAIRFFKRVIRPKKDLAALFSIASVAHLEQPLTKSVSTLIRAIKSLPKPKGATSLHDGLVEASNYLEDYSGRRVLVVVSDGQDTLSDTTFDEMVKIVQENNCQVYIVHTNDFENTIRTGNRRGSANLHALAAERRMKVLAEQTGGAVYSPIDERELDAAFRQISAELSQQYILGYYPENEEKDGRFRTIDLEIKSQKRYTIRARKGYYVTKQRKY